MNNSGEAVRAIVDWYKINLNQLFIIVDDKDLPLGKIRFRKKGVQEDTMGLKASLINCKLKISIELELVLDPLHQFIEQII